MRCIALFGVLLAAIPARAEADDALAHEVSISHGLIVGGYVPGAVVRPGSDVEVKDLPKADAITEVDLRLNLGAFGADFRPFMLTVPERNGPQVVGLHYEVFITPFSCPKPKDAEWDVPWKKPCVVVGFAHRSEHNQDDGTYGWTYTNGLYAKLRLRSSDEGRHGLWLFGQWVLGSDETPFALTGETDTVASQLENRLYLIGTESSFGIGLRGALSASMEFRASKDGFASFGKRLRYLHALDVGISDTAMFTLKLGVDAGMEYNFRKQEEMGRSAYRIGLVLLLPLG